MLFFLDEVICGGAEVLKAIKFIFILLRLVGVIIPIILILLVSFDLIKAITNKSDDLKSHIQIAIKRILMAVFIFLVPGIVSALMGAVGNLGVNYAECVTIAIHNDDFSQYDIHYDPVDSKDTIDLSTNKGNASVKEFTPDTDNSGGSSSGGSSSSSNGAAEDLGSHVFIGDSRTNGMHSAVGDDGAKWIYRDSSGYSWASVEGLNLLKSSVAVKGSNIFINMGVNDLDKYNEYAELYITIANTYKDSKVIAVSVNPVDDARSQFAKNGSIESFNTNLKSKISGVSNLYYCDTYSKIKPFLSDGSHYDAAGIHYDNTTYEKIYQYMLECLKK